MEQKMHEYQNEIDGLTDKNSTLIRSFKKSTARTKQHEK